MYWTIAPVALATPLSKPIFYDMQHSNNAARIRLWMQLKRPGGMEDAIATKMIQYPDLQSAEVDPRAAASNPPPLAPLPSPMAAAA